MKPDLARVTSKATLVTFDLAQVTSMATRVTSKATQVNSGELG